MWNTIFVDFDWFWNEFPHNRSFDFAQKALNQKRFVSRNDSGIHIRVSFSDSRTKMIFKISETIFVNSDRLCYLSN